MNTLLNHTERPRRSITGLWRSLLAHWGQPPEVIVHPASAALKRCFK